MKEREGVINRTTSFNKPECMGSRIQAGELALCRKSHVVDITGRGVDADEAYQWYKFREVTGTTDAAVGNCVLKLLSVTHLQSHFSLFQSRKHFRIQVRTRILLIIILNTLFLKIPVREKIFSSLSNLTVISIMFLANYLYSGFQTLQTRIT